MFGLGMGELALILAIVVLIFGASRLPQIGEGIGKGIRNLKRGLKTDDDIEVSKRVKSDNRDDVAEAEVVD